MLDLVQTRTSIPEGSQSCEQDRHEVLLSSTILEGPQLLRSQEMMVYVREANLEIAQAPTSILEENQS